MRRRTFMEGIAAQAAAWPFAARAQQPERMRRLGIVTAYAESDATPQSWIAALVQDLRELG
jgi:putative ABC transport system substrate-binding protein